MIKNYLLAIGVILSLALGFVGLVRHDAPVAESQEASGVTHLSGLSVGVDGFTANASTTNLGTTTTKVLVQGGGLRATSSNASSKLLASDFDTENTIDFNPLKPSLTLTLPASSTLTALAPVTGQVRTIYIRNATSTAAANGSFTIAGAAGTLLKVSSSTASGKVVRGDTDASNYARLDFIRKANTDLVVLMTLFND